jgi:hypothetical protein
MTTWKIWRALHNPPALHPVFKRVVLLPASTDNQQNVGWASLTIHLVLGLGQHYPTILLLLMPIILLFTGITYGIDCAIRVGNAIAKEHENDTFNLLSLSPSGALGASWAMCTSSLYHNRDFDRFHSIMRGTITIAIITIVLIASVLIIGRSKEVNRAYQPALPTVIHIVDLTAVMLALYFEYMQSAIVGSLIGMFVPTYTQNRVDTRIYTFGGFLFLQIATYFLAYLIGFMILPELYNRLQIVGEEIEMSLSILRLAVFFIIREIMITALWRILVERLNARPSELELTMQFAP